MSSTAVRAVGIDLGTTYSCVGAAISNGVETFENSEGNRTTPSTVAFKKNECVIGDRARSSVTDPQNIVYCAKRLIGRKYSDSSVQADIATFPFKVTADHQDRPLIEVQYQGQTRKFLPEQISAMVLSKMKETAEHKLGEGVIVTDAVITVPAYFNDAQRQATIDAAEIAGLRVLKLLNEPTAAAIAYGLKSLSSGSRNILVYDLGGGTFDVSAVRARNNDITVLATDGDTHLGGEDFDNILVDYFALKFNDQHGSNLFDNPRARRKLKLNCEELKRNLSAMVETRLEVEYRDEEFSAVVNRALFDDLCGELIRSTLDKVSACLRAALLSKKDIHHVLLVGGSTRIPLVQKVLSEFFGGKQLNMSLNPDEAVAQGAALQAALLTGVKADYLRDLKLSDVTPLSLGVGLEDGTVAPFIERNSTIPASITRLHGTAINNQRRVEFPIYEGERVLKKDNRLLGMFTIDNVPPAPAGDEKFDVTLQLDANGILHASAVNCSTGRRGNITITMNKGLLAEEEIRRMQREAERFKDEDRLSKELIEAKNQLCTLCRNIKRSLEDPKIRSKISESDAGRIAGKCADYFRWIESNERPPKEESLRRHREMEDAWNPIMRKLYSSK